MKYFRLTKTEQYFLQEFRKKHKGTRARFPLILTQKEIGNYRVDFLLPHKHLIVELDGKQHKELENMGSDIIRTNCLNKLGLDVIRFDNSEVYKNIGKIFQYIDLWACGENPTRNYCQVKGVLRRYNRRVQRQREGRELREERMKKRR